MSEATRSSRARAETFVLALAALSLLLGIAARIRIYAGSALPTNQPLQWFIGGFCQDVAISGLLALLLIALARRFPRSAMALAATMFFFIGLVQFILAEASIFFTHSLRAEDLQTGLSRRVFIGSAQGPLLVLFLAFVVIFFCALVAIYMRTREVHATSRKLRPILVTVIAAAGVAISLRGANQYGTSSHPFTAAIMLAQTNPLEHYRGEVNVPSPTEPVVNIRRLAAADGREFVDDAFPLAHRPPPLRKPGAPLLPAGVKPNIIFFLMEGVRAEEVGAYGGLPGLMPTFDRLAREGIFFTDVYGGGAFTPEAELGLWYGLLPSPYEIVIRTNPNATLSGIPDTFRKLGWRDFHWIHSGDQRLYLSSRFYRPHGVTAIDGESFPEGEPRTNWGYSDKALARHAIRLLDNAQEPFASMVLTVSNHHPYQLPPDAGPPFDVAPTQQAGGGRMSLNGRRTRSMLQTVHYTDEALDVFMKLAREQDWFSRTIFVITGDHGNSVAPFRSVESEHDLFTLRHRVPMLIYSPLLAPRVMSAPSAHVDIMPTLLGLIGNNDLRAGVGRDAFAAGERPLVSWNAQSGQVSVLRGPFAYHAAVSSDGTRLSKLSGESLVDRMTDRRGKENLLESHRQVAEEMRVIARSYLDIYGWLVDSGRSGTPAP